MAQKTKSKIEQNRNNMSRKKGHPKTGGRGKGTPNRVTTSIREWINEVLNNNRTQFEKDLKVLEPHQRVAIFEKLLAYSTPKLQSVEANIDLSQNQLSDVEQRTTEELLAELAEIEKARKI